VLYSLEFLAKLLAEFLAPAAADWCSLFNNSHTVVHFRNGRGRHWSSTLGHFRHLQHDARTHQIFIKYLALLTVKI
jgi:hypothetical protein